MREKLIELLKEADRKAFETMESRPLAHPFEVWDIEADHLITNGVVVPVRCKDCKHWADGVAGCTDHVKCCKIGYYMIGENGYCVYGERRNDGA